MWGYIIKEWNTSFIALIQKKKLTQTLEIIDLSLSNVSYIVIFKIITNRRKPFLDRIISPNQ